MVTSLGANVCPVRTANSPPGPALNCSVKPRAARSCITPASVSFSMSATSSPWTVRANDLQQAECRRPGSRGRRPLNRTPHPNVLFDTGAMAGLETVIVLLVAVLTLETIARRVLIPYPIFLVLGGLVLGVVPNLPRIELDPDLVFLIFLPPILWAAAYFTSLRDFRANLRPIALLAVGLVLATTAAVAAVARLLMPGMSWPVAVALGAIVSPPDAVAATAIARRLRIPYHIVTILEGESLINDAAALVLYRTAVVATVTGVFAPTRSLWEFVLVAVGGVAIGLAVGYVTCSAMRLAGSTLTQTAITLVAPYVAWVVAERLH